jgi:hypothetical protein
MHEMMYMNSDHLLLLPPLANPHCLCLHPLPHLLSLLLGFTVRQLQSLSFNFHPSFLSDDLLLPRRPKPQLLLDTNVPSTPKRPRPAHHHDYHNLSAGDPDAGGHRVNPALNRSDAVDPRPLPCPTVHHLEYGPDLDAEEGSNGHDRDPDAPTRCVHDPVVRDGQGHGGLRFIKLLGLPQRVASHDC